jgi:hypothetical protein
LRQFVTPPGHDRRRWRLRPCLPSCFTKTLRPRFEAGRPTCRTGKGSATRCRRSRPAGYRDPGCSGRGCYSKTG